MPSAIVRAIDATRAVEAEGMKVLQPRFIEWSDEGRYVLTNKGPLSRHLQSIVGDVVMNHHGNVLGVEVKIEAEDKWKRLFLETWSNRNLDNRVSHAEHGVNRGWLDHCRADWLFYYFVKEDDLYIIDLFALKQWAFGTSEHPGRIYQHAERFQRKYNQPNKTYGRCVLISVLARELGEQAFFHVRAKEPELGFVEVRFELSGARP